ncbi:MAG: YHS domain-containing protein [Polyangiales bacterium]|jgi:YHS domain-containing protein
MTKFFTRRGVLECFTALCALVFLSPNVANADINTNSSNRAIGGYDVVAYFTNRQPTRGLEEFRHSYAGATWLFTSAENRDQFAARPQRYAPQYGGYCAYAMAQGRRVRIDPRAWSIVRGKLYLNYSLQIRTTWSEDRAQHIESANENWLGLRP